MARINSAWAWAGLIVLALFAATAGAALTKKSDVLNSKHNLSMPSTGPSTRTITAVSESQICAFCHTPHGASTTDTAGNPLSGQLWNRRVPGSTTYTKYSSTSLDAEAIQSNFNGQPGGSSKLCLSCHDGTLALGTVNVINGTLGNPGVNIGMTGGVTTLPAGSYTANSGYTAVIGTDLTNDHPISVDYTNALAVRDGELRQVNSNALQNWSDGTRDIIGKRGPGYRPVLPLEGTGTNGIGQVQCASCHDPHIVDTDATKGDQMFLRLNRFQETVPAAAFNKDGDIICLGCHDKNTGTSWAVSSHGSSSVATQTYKPNAVTPRQFPTATTYKVWKFSCLNCHNGHTAPGAQRLLTEGTSAPLVAGPGGATPAGGATRQGAGGVAQQENTCYLCHTSDANSILLQTSGPILIDIQTQAALGSRHPITTATADAHSIGTSDSSNGCAAAPNKCGADGMESTTLLGGSRHAECTDCHNPHRVAKVQKISDALPGGTGNATAGGVHDHRDTTGYIHDNIASGVLRGTWGVEVTGWETPPSGGLNGTTSTPTSKSFNARPNAFVVKRGDPGNPGVIGLPGNHAFVTREYQVCIKCHSNYAYSDNNVYGTAQEASSGRPAMGGTGETAINSNGRANFTTYTNVAKEFQPAAGHTGDTPANKGNDGGACGATTTVSCDAVNHRSWHPVFGATGRTGYGAYYPPWNNAGARGSQTMYCSDCHGIATTTSATSVIPANRSPTAAHTSTSQSWGPHGGTTTNNTQVFMLKGVWNQTAGAATANLLCFKCHCGTMYGGNSGTYGTCTGTSGFNGSGSAKHTGRSDHNTVCQRCHTPIVHGWKNKSFLVNLRDIGPEAGRTVGSLATSNTYTNGPYYSGAQLGIRTMRPSGTGWTQTDCAIGTGTNH